MKSNKEVIHIPNFAISALQGITSLSALSETTRIQMNKMQRTLQNITSYQTSIFTDDSFNKSIECFQRSIQETLVPTRELIDEFAKATGCLNVNIAITQNISKNIILAINSIKLIEESYDGTIEKIKTISEIKEGASCLVSMSANLEEQNKVSNLVYKNATDIDIDARIVNIESNQKLILEGITTLKCNTATEIIPAKIEKISFLNQSHSSIEIDGKTINFRNGIAPIILYTVLGRKNFSRTRTYEVIDFYERYEQTLDWLDLDKEVRKKFQEKIYQSVRNINVRFMEAVGRNEKLILPNGNNSYILNPKLFK